MRFKLDENLPGDAARALRDAGFEADTVRDQGLSGAPDSAIATAVQREQRVLLTLDHDFCDIRTYSPGSYAGIIVMRLKRQDKISVLRMLTRMIPLLRKDSPAGRLWIVEADRIRTHGD